MKRFLPGLSHVFLLIGSLAILTPLTSTAHVPANTNKLYVDISIAAPGDGSSWSQAFRQLSDALAFANTNPVIDSILVAQGTYTPIGGSGIVNSDSSFVIRSSGGLSIVGGYPSGGGVLSYDLYPTILSGEIGASIPDDNAHHVIVVAGQDPGAGNIVIDNLIIKDAFAGTNSSYVYNGISISSMDGAGMYIHNAGNVSIRNCLFQDHGALGWGAALYNHQSSPLIYHCTFFRNTSFGRAGAIANVFNSNPEINTCKFTENMAMDGAGAIYNGQNSNARIINCEIYKSMTAGSGSSGAVFNESSSPLIIGCKVAGNQTTADIGGAAIYNQNATVRILNTYITGNYAATDGGGAALSNTANSVCILTNCVVYGNIGVNASGSIRNDASELAITNTILTGTNAGIVAFNAAVTNVNYSLVFGWTGGGTGNLNGSVDPLFVAPPAVGTGGTFTTGIFSLKGCSPCINAGTPDTTGLGLPDSVNEMRRIQLGQIDMGVDENNSLAEGNGIIPVVKTTAIADMVKGQETRFGTNCTEIIASIYSRLGNPVTGEASVTVDFDNGLLPGYVNRFYEIAVPGASATASGTVTLFFTQTEFDAYNAVIGSSGKYLLPDINADHNFFPDPANIRIRQLAGSLETIITPFTISFNAATNQWAAIFDVTGFGKFYLYTATNPALPLKLTGFEAKAENCIANISWTTAEESGVLHFELEQSTDGASWLLASAIPAKNTAGENKYAAKLNINAALNFYRLKMIDQDGTVTYSRIIRLNAPLQCAHQHIKLYPNPVKDILYLENVQAGDIFRIYDNAGRVIMQSGIRKAIQNIDVVKLPMGMYSITVMSRNGEASVMKFIRK